MAERACLVRISIYPLDPYAFVSLINISGNIYDSVIDARIDDIIADYLDFLHVRTAIPDSLFDDFLLLFLLAGFFPAGPAASCNCHSGEDATDNQ